MKSCLHFFPLLLLVAGALAIAQSNTTQTPRRSDAEQGKKLFNGQCVVCHGIEGTGSRGPALNVPKLQRAANETELVKIIREGIPNSEMPGAWQLTDREVRLVARYVRSLGLVKTITVPGDATRGKQLYETKGNCAACHVIRGQGGVSGPELTEISLRRSPAYLREALLNPNAAMPEGFLVVSIVTAEGQTLRGVRVNEDSFTIQLRAASGRFHSFRKADLKELKKEIGASTMPSYKDAFTTAELDDLVTYLYSLRGDK